MKPWQRKWKKLLWKIKGGKKSVFFEKKIDEMIWMWTTYSAFDYTCLGQRPRNSCPFVSKMLLVILVPHQLGILHGFPGIAFDLDLINLLLICVPPRGSLSLIQWLFFGAGPGIWVSVPVKSLLLHGFNHRVCPGWICTKLTKLHWSSAKCEPDSLTMNRFNLWVLKGDDEMNTQTGPCCAKLPKKRKIKQLFLSSGSCWDF